MFSTCIQCIVRRTMVVRSNTYTSIRQIKKPVSGFEPETSCLLGKCSTTKLYRLSNHLLSTLFISLMPSLSFHPHSLSSPLSFIASLTARSMTPTCQISPDPYKLQFPPCFASQYSMDRIQSLSDLMS